MAYAIKQYLTYDDERDGIYLFDTEQEALEWLKANDEEGEVVEL